MDAEQLAAMERHGYPTNLPRRDVGGGPGRVYCGYTWNIDVDGRWRGRETWARNRVCYLDGVEIDGHETSDITYDSKCIHCGELTK